MGSDGAGSKVEQEAEDERSKHAEGQLCWPSAQNFFASGELVGNGGQVIPTSELHKILLRTKLRLSRTDGQTENPTENEVQSTFSNGIKLVYGQTGKCQGAKQVALHWGLFRKILLSYTKKKTSLLIVFFIRSFYFNLHYIIRV